MQNGSNPLLSAIDQRGESMVSNLKLLKKNSQYRLRKILSMFLIFVFLSGCAVAQKRRETYVNNHPETSKEYKEAILNGDVKVGMSRKEVQASLGTPWDKATSASAFFERVETWSYGECLYKCDQIIFDKDGKVVDFDTYKDEE